MIISALGSKGMVMGLGFGDWGLRVGGRRLVLGLGLAFCLRVRIKKIDTVKGIAMPTDH